MKKVLLIIFSIICFYGIEDVKAVSANGSLSCDKSVLKEGDVITCTVKGSATAGGITSLSANVKLSSNLSLASIETSNIWQGNGEGGKILLYTDVPKDNNFDIATFRVNVNGNVDGGYIKVDDVIFYDENYQKVPLTIAQHNVRSGSNNNNLASLSLSNATINFSKDVTTYNINSSNTSMTITATAEDSRARVSGGGTVNINYGNNKYNIIVTSEVGTTKTYVINVYREDTRSKVNTLKYIKINGSVYDANVDTHTINVGNLIDKITISSGLTDDKKSNYISGYGNRTVDLKEGHNQILVKVKAENESIKVYTFNVYRAEKNAASQNIDIKELTIRNHDDFVFVPGLYYYQLNLNETERQLLFTIVLDNENASYKIENNEDLKDGDMIVIKVTSEDKSVTQDYRIKILKNDSNLEEDDDEQDEIVEEEKDDNSFMIALIVFFIGLLVFIIALIYKMTRKNNNSQKNVNNVNK